MTYLDEVRDGLIAELPDLDPNLLDLYALLVYAKGQQVTFEDVHNAWALWTVRCMPGHKLLIPFSELEPDVQGLDEPYVNAIRVVATARMLNVPRETKEI